MNSQAPEGFIPLNLPLSGFLSAIGPFFGRLANDQLTIGLGIEPRHCNSNGVAHGGMILSLVDVVLTVGSNFNADLSRFLLTISVTCDFARAVPVHAWIEGEAEVLHLTNHHVFSQLTLRDGDGEIAVRASGILQLRGNTNPSYSRAAYLNAFL